MAETYDFSGWATKNDLLCSDGRTIRRNAFKDNDGKVVPLVWNHDHNSPENVLGHALLQNRPEGVYVYGAFNDTDSGVAARKILDHGDIVALSIWANKLKEQGGNVMHGDIKEVSLVLAGANPGACIEHVIRHGEEAEDAAVIYVGEENAEICHCDVMFRPVEEKPDETLEHADEGAAGDKKNEPEQDKRTLADVIETLNEEQKTAVFALVTEALAESREGTENNNDDEEDKPMKHNVFDQEDTQQENILSHSDMEAIFSDMRRYGSLRDAVAAHDVTDDQIMHAVQDSSGTSVTYGMADIDYLFPDARMINNTPGFISRKMDWVSVVMNGVHHTPFSRIKSIFANITNEDARAKGYTKGKKKLEEVFTLLKRTTTPTTVYKKQKLDRDDVVDITSFDVVAWLKAEMRTMLDEELARAYLIGDGRTSSSDDKINEQNIRPIWTDDDLYTIKATVTATSSSTADQIAKAFIRTAIKARKDYQGSGNPILFTTEDILTDCLLLEDTAGRIIYDTQEKLATALRVSRIVTVPVMEGRKRTDSQSKEHELMGIIVNLNDYNVGADKGGAVSMFDDFDIDYNQQKYLIETRCSGALTVPYSAIAIEKVTTSP